MSQIDCSREEHLANSSTIGMASNAQQRHARKGSLTVHQKARALRNSAIALGINVRVVVRTRLA